MSNNESINEFSIVELFNKNDSYLIPTYQRNFAWTKAEVEQLVMDINDYSKKNIDKNYYIGTLVVFQREGIGKRVFETIDGQQRLTTLSILLSVLKNEFNNEIKFNHLLKYESRETSTNTLMYIYEGKVENQENLNPTMENAYKIIKQYLKNLEKQILENFIKYLLNNVKILRVSVPKDTDLNHYFEIMNNRGEQLEKHEVLKARMLEKLDNDNDKKTFNDIWEACSDMYRYIQYSFNPNSRNDIFGLNWDSFVCNDFDQIKKLLYPQVKDENSEEVLIFDEENSEDVIIFDIDYILSDKCKTETINEKKDDEKPDRFISPINFPNFLLHVYKVTKNKAITLDDKGLLDSFNDYDKVFVKDFGFNLLKMRFLFDNYVIKREYLTNNDSWSLQQAYKSENNIQFKNRFAREDDKKHNEQLVMLLSMFHVSNPSQIYKYWLTGVLNYLFNNYNYKENGINPSEYIENLENLAEDFLKNRYLAINSQAFDDIIFNDLEVTKDIDILKLDIGTSVEHFVFNYLDYLIWKNNKKTNIYDFSYFNFSFSNSVEHFYPQNPIEGHKPIENIDCFGNLCLISVSKNAKLNNHPPKSKKEYYPNNQYDSLKQHIMMDNADSWNENCIEKHKEKMLGIFNL